MGHRHRRSVQHDRRDPKTRLTSPARPRQHHPETRHRQRQPALPHAHRRNRTHRHPAEAVLTLHESAGLGRTLRKWKAAFLAYWTTGRSNNGGTEAINGLIELHRRLARGYRNRDNYRLRMLLIAGGLRT